MSGFERLGRYDIIGQLGRGSFGVVYHGQDPLMKKDVAIKVCTLDDPSLRQRFVREAEISRQLEHENIVSVQAFAEENDVPYLVQEFLRGEDLKDVIHRREPWTLEQRLDVLQQIARGLAYAHTRGIIHRDIKPANVRILPDRRAKIMDFGIAKLANEESQLTQKGVTMGTASYLPPEQVRGGDISHRADIFSFGVLAYELLCFQRPFRGKTISALVYQILYKAPDPLATVWPTCPPELSELISRCLEKDAGKRCPDMDTVVGKLMEIRQGAAEGRWPSLVTPTSPPPGSQFDEEPSTSSGILSQSLIARAAKDVTREVRAADVAAARATQPMSAMSAQTQKVTVPEMMESAVTQRVVLDPPPAAAQPSIDDSEEMPTIVGSKAPGDGLESSAEEISKLVASGDLQAAMSQLESTIQQRDHSTELPAIPGAPANAGALPDLPIVRSDPPRPSQPIDGVLPHPPSPGSRQKASSGRTSSKAATASRSTKSGPPKIAIGIGIAILILLTAGIGMWLGRKDAPELPVAVEAPLELPPTEQPEPPMSSTGIVVVASPWAEVLEVTDITGSVQALPDVASTPLFLPLPEGRYRVTLSFSETTDSPEDEERICEVEVFSDDIVTCNERLEAAQVKDFFKENGWWL